MRRATSRHLPSPLVLYQPHRYDPCSPPNENPMTDPVPSSKASTPGDIVAKDSRATEFQSRGTPSQVSETPSRYSVTAPPSGETSVNVVRSPRFLPKIGSRGYYLLLAAVAILILGPLGGISAAFMNFSIGFFVGGQVLAGILGSAVTLGYGAEG